MAGAGRARAEDRMCRAGALDNPFRRRLAPPLRELDLLGARPGEVVADLGAGVGYYLPALAAQVGAGGRLYAVDIDEENLAIARRRPLGPVPVRFLLGSAARVPEIPEASVDRVLLSLVLCCLVDKRGAMGETWRILRPGGRVLVSYPRAILLRRGARAALRMTPARWRELLRDRPWRELPTPNGLLVRRHRLEKPGPPPAPSEMAKS